MLACRALGCVERCVRWPMIGEGELVSLEGAMPGPSPRQAI